MRVEHLPADVLPLAPLARAALSGRPRPTSLPGTLVPGEVAAVPRPEERHEPDERAALAETLEARLAPLEPHVAVLDAVRALARPGTTLVLAGQQPGFLGGPLYDLYKALSAVRLARALADAWGRPVVAAFWNHADDHDVAEVHHLHLLNPNLDLTKVALPGMSSGRVPIGALPLDAEAHRLGPIRETVRELLAAAPHRDRALELFLPRDGETLAGAFTRAYTALLGPLGLVVLEPEWIRGELSRRLADVVAAHPLGPLRAGAEALRAAGHAPAIEPDGAALVYRHGPAGEAAASAAAGTAGAAGEAAEAGGPPRRSALRAGGEGFRYDDEPGSRTPEELAAEIVQEPGAWSAGALLRPVVQDLALPVAAYVGGWGELAYHAELRPLRDTVGAPATPFVPRLSATLVDPETDRSLERLGLEVGAALRDGGRALAEAAGEEEEGPPVAAALRAVAGRAGDELQALRDELAALDRGLGGQVRKTAKQVADLVERLAGKAERVHANATGKGRRHLRRVRNALLPRDLPQERVLGALPFVARFGTGWIAALAAEVEPFPTEHLVVRLEDGDADAPEATP